MWGGDQADEADRPHEGDRERGQEADPKKSDEAQPCNGNAEAPRPVFAEAQGRQLPSCAERGRKGDGKCGGQQGDLRPAWP